jgi:autotransporter-associated beta strand protein
MNNDIPNPPFKLNQVNFMSNAPALSLNSAGTLEFDTNGSFLPTIKLDASVQEIIFTPVTLANNLTITGSGTGQIIFANNNLSGAGSLTMSGAGTLGLGGNVTNAGGLFVTSGTAMLASGVTLQTNVTISGTGIFNTGVVSNTAATAIANVSVSGSGQFVVPSGSGNFYLNKLTMTAGTVDLSGISSYALHLTGSGASVTTNVSAIGAVWKGVSGASLSNDTGSAVNITVNGGGPGVAGIDLDCDLALTGAGGFVKAGPGLMRLTNLGSTAPITIQGGYLRVDDATTSGVGALGTGNLTINGGALMYGGTSGATTTKSIAFGATSGTLGILKPGVTWSVTGPISSAGGSIFVYGFGNTTTPSTVIFGNSTNAYTQPTIIEDGAVVQIASITDGGNSSPIGAAPSGAGSILLGDGGGGGTSPNGRGTLMFAPSGGGSLSTNRGVTTISQYANNGGGAIGVAAATTLTMSGQITGQGAFVKTGPGVLALTNATNNYAGGTYVEAGTLSVGAGNVIPAASNVTVATGATFQVGASATTGFGNLTLNGGTLSFPAGNPTYNVANIVTTAAGSSVDMTGSSAATLGLTGVTIGSGPTNIVWTGASTSSIVNNNSNNPLVFTIPPNTMLSEGIILGRSGSSYGITVNGGGAMRLTNPGNRADITVMNATLYTNDMTTNSGSGQYGTLGIGAIVLQGGTSAPNAFLVYDGQSASSDKLIILNQAGEIIVPTPGVNLHLANAIGQAGSGGAGFTFSGSGVASNPSTLTVSSASLYGGATLVRGNGILAFDTIGNVGNGGISSTFGTSSNLPSNVYVADSVSRGDLLYTGANAATDRGVTLQGQYSAGTGGGIGVQNPSTTLTWNGQLVGASFVKSGPGTLVIGNAQNSYSGGTYVEAGTLVIGQAGALPAGPVVVLGGTLDATATSAIPAGNDVTVNAGGTLSLFLTRLTTPGTMYLNGGTLNMTSGAFSGNVAALNLTGGTVANVGGTQNFSLGLSNSTGIISNTSSKTSIITLPATSFPHDILNQSGSPCAIQVAGGTTPSGVDLDLFAPLGRSGSNPSFVKTGPGVLRLNSTDTTADLVVSQGYLRVDAVAAFGSGNLSLTGGTLLYGGPSTSAGKAITLDQNISGITVLNAGTTLTLTSPLTGGGGLAISGPGTLVLPTGSTYSGGTVVDGATLAIANDSMFGNPSGRVSVVSDGTLVFTATSLTARAYSVDTSSTLQVSAGQVLSLSSIGGRINGGFLAGPGTFDLNGTVSGVNSAPNAVIQVSGTMSNSTNGGNLSTPNGTIYLTTPGSFPALSRFTNQGSGSVTIGKDGLITVSDFQSYGTVTIMPSTVNSGETTLMKNVGTTPLYFNGGSRTFVGTPATATSGGSPTFVAGIDLNGNNAIVAGGLFVNNGYVVDTSNNFAGTGTVVADFGSLVKGAGFYENSVITQNGGKFQAGNSPGAASFGKFVLGPGGVSNYVFAIDDATGSAGPAPDAAGRVSGWGLVKTIGAGPAGNTTPGDFTWTATPADKLYVSLETLVNPTTVGVDVPGSMDHFDPTREYVWPAVEWTGRYIGPADTAELDAATAFDTTGFLNPIAGSFGWRLDATGQTLSLVYTPSAVAEPGTLVLAGFAAMGLGIRRRIRRR